MKEDILCNECGEKMVEDQYRPPRSLDMYSGSTNITHTSVATHVTASTLGTRTTPDSSQSYTKTSFKRRLIRITNYTCPSCGCRKQIRD